MRESCNASGYSKSTPCDGRLVWRVHLHFVDLFIGSSSLAIIETLPKNKMHWCLDRLMFSWLHLDYLDHMDDLKWQDVG